MDEFIKLGHLGLGSREIRVLKSVFSLSPDLKQHYVLTDQSELRGANVVLVNADSREAVQQWNRLSAVNKQAKPMALSSQGNAIGDSEPLALPIRLPRLIKALQEAAKDSTVMNLPSSGGDNQPVLRILVVDDSLPVRKYMEQKIAESVETSTQISFAGSGEEALLKCKGRAYDLVFLDVVMDGMDGYKVCKTIKSNYKTYVVMLTSKKSPFDKVRGTMSGCDAYITKPPEDKRLKEEIRKGFRHKLQRAKNETKEQEKTGFW